MFHGDRYVNEDNRASRIAAIGLSATGSITFNDTRTVYNVHDDGVLCVDIDIVDTCSVYQPRVPARDYHRHEAGVFDCHLCCEVNRILYCPYGQGKLEQGFGLI